MSNINNRALRFRQVKGYARHPGHTRSTFAPVGNAAANVRVYLYGDERDKCCPYGCGFIVCGCEARAAKPGVSIRGRLYLGEWIVDGEPAKPAEAPLREGWVGVDFGYQFRSGECCMRVYRSHSTGLFAVYSVEPEGLLNTTYYERLEEAMVLGERVAHEIEARAKPVLTDDGPRDECGRCDVRFKAEVPLAVEFAKGDVVRLLSNDGGIGEAAGTLLVVTDTPGDIYLRGRNPRFLGANWSATPYQLELVRRAGEFVPGDKVRCVSNLGAPPYFTVGREYTVASVETRAGAVKPYGTLVRPERDDITPPESPVGQAGMWPEHFELVEPAQ